MQRSFKSKVDNWVYVVICMPLAPLILCIWFRQPLWSILFAVIAIFFIQSLLRTDYIVRSDHTLLVKSGYLPAKHIKITTITGIESTRGIRFYALSSDHLKITYGDKSVCVSPADRSGFLAELHKYNQGIPVYRSTPV